MAKLVSKTYGDALFELAVEDNRTDSMLQEIEMVQSVLKENGDLQEKLQVIETVFKGHISDALTGFLRIVVTKGRYKDLPDIFAYFIARVKEYRKIGVAEVVSAVPLSESQKDRIERKLLDTTRYETMEIDYKVDESKIGGLMIRIGDRVVDSTIQSNLTRLTAGLMKISLENEKEGEQAS